MNERTHTYMEQKTFLIITEKNKQTENKGENMLMEAWCQQRQGNKIESQRMYERMYMQYEPLQMRLSAKCRNDSQLQLI